MIHLPISFFAASAREMCQQSGFLGLKPWWYYLPDEKFHLNAPGDEDAGVDTTCSIKEFIILPNDGANSDIPLVLVAIVDDLLRVAGMVAVGFVIVGAIQYITSQGEPEKTAQAQSTIINALIGLAIAVISVAFVSFAGHRLGG